jgi:hypothetical protein
MEDEHIAVDRYGGVDKGAYFAVYDGHGETFSLKIPYLWRWKRNSYFYKRTSSQSDFLFILYLIENQDIITELHHCKEFSPEAPDDKIKHEKIEQAITRAFLKTGFFLKDEKKTEKNEK